VVDLDALFRGHERRDLFWDTMHPSTKGHGLIAASLGEAIAEMLKGQRGAVIAGQRSARDSQVVGRGASHMEWR